MSEKQVIEQVDRRDLMMSHLVTIERDLGWLAKKLGRPYSTMYSIMVKKSVNLSDDCADKINQLYGGTNF